MQTARITAFPTSLLVSLGSGEAASLELTTPVTAVQLDQIAVLHRLADDAEHARVEPRDGLARLDEIRELAPRFGPWASIGGYGVLTVGIALILHPALRDVLAAALFGLIVGALRLATRRQPTLQIMLPVVAAFCIAALTSLAVKHDLADPGLRAMIAALAVFLPGAALTTSVLELARGDMIAGSSRLVWSSVQLMLLAFGIVAGIEAVGVSSSQAFSSSDRVLGGWAPWLGVRVFAVGGVVGYAAPRGAFTPLLVLVKSGGVGLGGWNHLFGGDVSGLLGGLPMWALVAWVGQVVGTHLFGGFVSGLVGALVMTPAAAVAAHSSSALPVYALFLPGFWLLVPGALSLIGLTRLAGDTSAVGSGDFLAVVGSIIAVALGVLCGTLLLEWGRAGLARRERA